jgi:wyosine [tRNA(Phe)-imidazoG37] synthetase (radical SAM superfamily)
MDNKEEMNSLRKFREYSTASLALIIIVGAFIMIGVAMARAENFDQIKDLLLFINPILGVAIGYYFNKASSEARAENAEKSAEKATEFAETAQKDKAKAEAVAQKKSSEIQTMEETLDEVVDAAERMMKEESAAPSRGPGVLSFGDEDGEETSPAASNTKYDLENALRRAKRLRGKG